MFDITEIETDKDAEVSGVWRPYKGGAALLIARRNNPKYRSFMRSKVKANRAVLDNEDDLADSVGEDIVMEAAARTLLLGWKGIALKGEELPYNHENALKLIKGSREFRETVMAMADESEAYRKKQEDAAVGN